jgi:hypothetical protein
MAGLAPCIDLAGDPWFARPRQSYKRRSPGIVVAGDLLNARQGGARQEGVVTDRDLCMNIIALAAAMHPTDTSLTRGASRHG